jgi:MYXO-CTERM domain-containing protein
MKRLFYAMAAALLPGIAGATVVNIDFNTSASATYTGLAAAADPQGALAQWNAGVYVSGSGGVLTINDLVDSAGVPTQIDFTVSGIESAQNSPIGDQETQGGYLNLMRDFLRIDTGSTTNGIIVSTSGKFSGLVVGGTYELYFFGQGNNFGSGFVSGGSITQGQNSLFTVDSISKQTEWDNVGSNGIIGGGDGSLAENIEFVKFSAVADSNGEIAFQWANVVQGGSGNVTTDLAPSNAASGTLSSRYGALNAVQLVAVIPEPSSAILAFAGLAGLCLRRRRD